MEIIPVIDLMGGIVVQARAGDRTHYQPIRSILSKSIKPIQVIKDLLDFFPFNTIYLADLDAIMHGIKVVDLYSDISRLFPQTEIWLDSGVRVEQEAEEILALPNIHCIIASETILETAWLETTRHRERIILSLDYQQGQVLGNETLCDAMHLWPTRIIAMNLDYVGCGTGPDYSLISSLQAQGNFNIIAAGGIREQDLHNLHELKIRQVLMASALHAGKMKREIISYYFNL